MNAEDIASALDFSGKKGEAVVNALLESGYLELENGTFKIHDWYDYAGKLMDRREADKKRKQKPESGKTSAGIPTEIPKMEDGNPYATVPNRTVPNQNNNIHTNAHARTREMDDGFERFWAAYPRKSGDIRQAFMEYRDVINSGVDPETLIQAITAQTAGVTAEDLHFLPGAEKWLRNRGWESKASLKSPPKETKAKPKQYVTAAEYKPKQTMSVDDIAAIVDAI